MNNKWMDVWWLIRCWLGYRWVVYICLPSSSRVSVEVVKTQHEIFLISFIDVVAISVAFVAADVATHADVNDNDDDVVHFVANGSGIDDGVESEFVPFDIQTSRSVWWQSFHLSYFNFVLIETLVCIRKYLRALVFVFECCTQTRRFGPYRIDLLQCATLIAVGVCLSVCRPLAISCLLFKFVV